VTFPPVDRLMQQAQRGSKILGVRLAIVVDNKDGEGNPGFRVKLKLPWLSEQDTTCWARIAIPMGGSGRGTYVLPEIDDQVLVVFEHGDIDRPIVIGALWSKNQEPVEVNQSGKNNTKLIKSRCGHRIIFDDKQGAERITIVDKTKKNKIVLDSVNKIIKIESDGDIEVQAKTNVILHANALKVGTSQGVTGKAASLLAHAAKTFGLKASSGITIGGGDTTINTSNAAACNVSGSGAGELGGAAEQAPKDQVEETRRAADGGGSAAAAAAANRTFAPASVAATPGPVVEDDEKQIEVQIVNVRGEPQRDVRFELTLPDGTVKSGTSAADGYIRISGLKQSGTATLVFPEIDATVKTRY
jgi:phage baseplate assembly protein gpV